MMSKSVRCCFFILLGVMMASAQDKCHFENLFKCGQPIQDFRKTYGQSFPTTQDQVDDLCNGLKQGVDCTEDFSNKCMSPMQLQLMGLFTEGSTTVFNEFCTTGSDMQKDYLQNAQCLNDAFQTEEYRSMQSYVEATLEVFQEKKSSEKIPVACCGYQWMVNRSTKLGEEKCGKGSVDSFFRVAEIAISSLPTVVCQGFDPDSTQCTGFLPPPDAKPTGSLRNSRLAEMVRELVA